MIYVFFKTLAEHWVQQINNKLHELHYLIGKTLCSYGQTWQGICSLVELVVVDLMRNDRNVFRAIPIIHLIATISA